MQYPHPKEEEKVENMDILETLSLKKCNIHLLICCF